MQADNELSYPVSGVVWAIDCVGEICAKLPQVIRWERTSPESGVYYFMAPLTGPEVAQLIIGEWKKECPRLMP